jgi:hypothetical protein
MEIRNPQSAGSSPEHSKLTELRSDALKASREASAKTLDGLTSSREARSKAMEVEIARMRGSNGAPQGSGKIDRLDLSESSRVLAHHDGGGQERAARLAEIRTEIEQGTFHSPERAERAAARLLGGS